jgi:hypothetical protein
MIQTIVDNLITLVGAQLPSEYSEIDHLLDLQKNAFKKSSKRYGVRVLGSSEQDGTTRHTTHDHTFEVVLTDWYQDPVVSDTDQRTKGIALQYKQLQVYAEVVRAKAGTPQHVALVTGLSISEPEYIEGDNVVAVRATFDIRYRQSLT